MKFLCPQCKAKYRIADEKLAQRASSKMKCRKCGFVIDIQTASVPETVRPPGAPAPTDGGEEIDEPPARKVPRVAPTVTAPATATATAPRRVVPTASTAKRVPVPSPKRATGGGGVPPRRGRAVAAVAEAVPEPSSPVTPDAAPPAARAPIPAPGPVPAPTPAPVQAAAPDPNEFDDEGTTRIHDGGALTAAFSQSMAEKGPAAAAAQPAPDEWYVGIDGSPTGPLSTGDLRRKAVERKMTLDSLVWKEGFEDWKPLREFPELVTIVEEAQDALLTEPKTVPAPSPLEEQQQQQAAARAGVPSVSNAEVLEQLGVTARKPAVSHPVAWAAMAVAMAFGVTLGIVVFSKTERQEVVKYVEVPASASAAAAANPGDPEVIEEAQVSGGSTKHTGTTSVKPPEPVAAGTKPSNTGLLNGLSAGLGPAGGNTDVAGGSAPGGQLDGTSIQRVVANFSSSVRRGCWDPAIVSRAPDAPPNARVGVTITISPSGSVDNVTTTGDPKGYPSLAHCIESKVRAWRFPRSSGTTTAQVPFVFAAQ